MDSMVHYGPGLPKWAFGFMIVMLLPGTTLAYCGPSGKGIIGSVLAQRFCFCLVGFPALDIAGHCSRMAGG
jgi:hypothetical protein